MPRALVTGATGLVGSHIVDRLLSEGWAVRALVRGPRAELARPGVETTIGDILDRDVFERAARGVDVIFHTAAAVTARGGWEAYRRPNIDGTRHAIAAAERSGARLLQLSSVAVYGPTARYRGNGAKTGEDTPLEPLPADAHYARSKRESEQLVLEAHASGRIWAAAVRPDVIYGIRDRQFTPRIARLLRFGVMPLVCGGTSTLPIVHAANVAQGAVLAATCDRAAGRAFNLANDYDVTVRRFFELAAEGLERRVRFVRVPMAAARVGFTVGKFAARVATGGRFNAVSNASLAMLTEDNPFTSERAKRELGWAPAVHPEQGIPEAFAWTRTHR